MNSFKTYFTFFVSFFVSVAIVACTKKEGVNTVTEKLSEQYGYAIYYGALNADFSTYSCAFTNAKLDESFEITAPGYSVILQLGTKINEQMEDLPNVSYPVSNTLGVNKVLAGTKNGDEMSGSFLLFKEDQEATAKYYPIEEGSFTKDGTSFSGKFKANGIWWKLSFEGKINYYDFSPNPKEPETDLCYAQALFFGEYYSGVNNYTFDVVKSEFDQEHKTVGPYTWLTFDLNAAMNQIQWGFVAPGTYTWTAYNSSNAYSAGTFVEGTIDEDGEFYPTFVETYDGNSNYSFVFLCTAGTLTIERDGSDYIINASLTFDNSKTYNFTYKGTVLFFDKRESESAFGAKKFTKSIYSEHCRRKAVLERLHNNWGCSGFDSTSRNCKHAVR